MAIRREDASSELQNFQIGSSWVPETPAKPGSTNQQPIYTNWQETHRVNSVAVANAPRPRTITEDFLQEFDSWQAAISANSRKDSSIYDSNLSFGSLLALAEAGGNPAAIENALTNHNFAASSNSSGCFRPQVEGGHFSIRYGSHSQQDQGNLFVTSGSSVPCLFDLNSPPKMIADLGMSGSSQFEPITPQKNNKAEYRLEESATKDLSVDEVPANKEKEDATGGVIDLHKKEKSSTQLQENHKPDKGGIEEADLSKTPQQKSRRKKHRPKVIIEGQKKKTPKSSAPPKSTTEKRKYVRRNKVNSPIGGGTNETDLDSQTPSPAETPVEKRKNTRRKKIDKPMDEGTSETKDVQVPRYPRRSCRRSLNFNSDDQVRDGSSSYCASPNGNRESQAENLNTQEMEEMIRKNDMVTSEELACSVNQVKEGFLSRPEEHSRNPSPSTNHMFTDQIVYTRGKCQIVFSDVTHDKEANTVQVSTNADNQLTPKSPSDSICSSACLTPEKEERGLKRKSISTAIQAELRNRIETGMFYKSMQAYATYLPTILPREKMDSTRGLHFPTIYKKKRTEKSSTVTSSIQITASNSKNHAKLERNALGYSCTKLSMSPANQGYSGGQVTASTSKNHAKLERNALEYSCTKLSMSPANQGYSGGQITASTSKNHAKLERNALGYSCTKLSISSANQGYSGGQVDNLLITHRATDDIKNGRQLFEDLLALGPTQRIKKRRSRGPTRRRDLASLLEDLPAFPGNAATSSKIRKDSAILHGPHTCMEALVADTRSTMITKKRSKRSTFISSTVQNFYNHQNSASTSMGPPLALTWKNMSLVDSVIEQLKRLNLNAESSQDSERRYNALMVYNGYYSEQRALVPFQHSAAVVPFDASFDQVRRRRPRPKVDLDDETTRVWKLLLENINSEGVDGTDEEKAKWWEEERRVFRGRADSFIARMHLVQGDRRFSPWKGSVVDSVVGVFLTQNVSDHLSSSAFMSMAARYAHKSEIHPEELHEEKLGSNINEPEVCVLDSDSTFGLNKEIVNQSVCGEDTKISEIETPKSISLIEDGRDTEDTLSSQTPEISSQNSVNSPVAVTTERTDSYLPSTLEKEPAVGVKLNQVTNSTGFAKLLQMAGTVLQGAYKGDCDKKTSDDNRHAESESLASNLQTDGRFGNPTFPAKTSASCSQSTLCYVPDSGAQAAASDLTQRNSKFADTYSNKEFCTADLSELSSESACGTIFQKTTAVSFEEVQKISSPNAHSSNNEQIEINKQIVGNHTDHGPAQNKMQGISENPTYSHSLMDATGSTSNIDNSKGSEHKEVTSNKNNLYDHPGNMVTGAKAKGGRPKKEKENPIDWDHLRKQAHPAGTERARPTNNLDSVDWEAVRCADVNEIAETIKERGMNNMLAERIKDFLNRIVRDHGSIDLEWLRDVPPDKAKEYLLSIRGLGLKSVECVRLLTLHHLAFPVDTNVGRIAVRLGWVPLQPLPESLQLHLLELYPILESIQKFLWPRLCKLDQKTLYELHYQMITFGKVFCTKNKPNCNACPMRGECRHFASAFASARLALPAPQEKSIVSATENRKANQNPVRSMNTLQLPSTQVNEMIPKSGVSNSQPIIEEPPSPGPIIEVPATPEPDETQVLECDIENAFDEDPDEIPTIQLNMEEFTHNLQSYIHQNTELQEVDMSKALVALTSSAASIPVPKLKNMSRLRTEHQVYELPDSHPLLEGMDKREPDDPSPYLLAIWTPGETVNSIEPPERRCSSQGFDKLCSDETCASCNSIREANSQTVRGTLLIPCRTAMRGSFPLNGTYFQVNEVFSDHESSLSPIDVPRQWLWNLPRRTVYFGTSIPTIFKGLSTEGIQYCFWRGFVCVRGFDRITRAPRPLIARLHFPASKLAKGKGKMEENNA
ncbi:hypothetical protein ACS0TY_015476 [Phlomoides rotata]